ncbi:UPF0271 protein [Evansella vedderi]|uniref:5-oxoprolinase subunit A n=1 Tax=Evansella vedderi TaxID=38282 RepID=A0ABT9ZTW0_9BACI|nr:5-oxoprolinase subunit PxpA [Evansella vedderi]MDQ0254677.1 UPF0271 protein [Evansella vedderi]
MYKVDLNSDLGESFGVYMIGQDEEILKVVTSANIACGFHAGDPDVMWKTVKMAVENNVGIGAHPGFPDLQGFGRRDMRVSPKEVYNMMVYQIGALNAFTELHGGRLNHVKPHGALYNMASACKELAEAVAESIYHLNPRLILFGLAGSELVKAGRKLGLYVAEEVFADRTYQRDGTLTPRSFPNSMVKDPDEAVERVIKMIKEQEVETIDGTVIPIQADTICVHGDEPSALRFVRHLRASLHENGIYVEKVGG